MFTDDVVFFQKAVMFHPHTDQFLVLKRSSDGRSPNIWDLPGGGGVLVSDICNRC